MIDCHCHLADNKFKDDIDSVISSAVERGVSKAVVVPEYRNQWEKVLSLRDRYPNFVIASIGVHPIQVNEFYE